MTTEHQDGTNLEGEKPTAEAQERYYQLSSLEAAFQHLQKESEEMLDMARKTGANISTLRVVDERLRLAWRWAQNDVNRFLAGHSGAVFKVFRPEDIEAAFDNDIEQWDLLSLDNEEQKAARKQGLRLAPHLQKFREQRLLSLRKLSRLSGVDRRTIHNIEIGHAARPETLRKLAVALNLSVNKLIESED